MKISQTTLDKIKEYILNTQKNSTYNSAPHEPLEMCWNPNVAYQWNMCNCYGYLNRYLAKEGEKRGNIQDLLKCCHYAWFNITSIGSYSFEEFKVHINQNDLLDDFIENALNGIDINLKQKFIDDDAQIYDKFWLGREYFQLATLLIQEHIENEQEDSGKTDPYGNYYIDLETT